VEVEVRIEAIAEQLDGGPDILGIASEWADRT
jgi:hypothetical protein